MTYRYTIILTHCRVRRRCFFFFPDVSVPRSECITIRNAMHVTPQHHLTAPEKVPVEKYRYDMLVPRSVTSSVACVYQVYFFYTAAASCPCCFFHTPDSPVLRKKELYTHCFDSGTTVFWASVASLLDRCVCAWQLYACLQSLWSIYVGLYVLLVRSHEDIPPHAVIYSKYISLITTVGWLILVVDDLL